MQTDSWRTLQQKSHDSCTQVKNLSNLLPLGKTGSATILRQARMTPGRPIPKEKVRTIFTYPGVYDDTAMAMYFAAVQFARGRLGLRDVTVDHHLKSGTFIHDVCNACVFGVGLLTPITYGEPKICRVEFLARSPRGDGSCRGGATARV